MNWFFRKIGEGQTQVVHFFLMKASLIMLKMVIMLLVMNDADK